MLGTLWAKLLCLRNYEATWALVVVAELRHTLIDRYI